LIWYGVWGALHECTHLLTAVATGLDADMWDDGVVTVLARTLLLRQCVIPAAALQDDHDVRTMVVRHAGWIMSVLVWIVLALWSYNNQKKQQWSHPKDNAALVVASLTAL
jgi:hypothetical protein